MTIAAVAPELRTGIESELFERICVRPPYFALQSPAWTGGEFSAVASAEFPASLEVGPMRAAERGRHGAIAGLCALAMSQGDSARRYYLATGAHYSGFCNKASYGSPLGFVARVEELNKRSARSTITATVLGSGELAMDLSVDYMVLPEATFERLYRDRRQPTETTDHLVSPTSVRASRGARTITSLPASCCAGHFESFPALPLAVVVGELTDMCSELLAKPHWVADARIQARELCWAGQNARFEASLEAQPLADHAHSAYACRALSDNRALASMQLVLSSLLE